jgi:tetratricopeptide (TPR) repeat protein
MMAAESGRDYEEAAAIFHEALSIAQDIGQRFGEIVILNNLGGVWVKMGQYQAAETDLKRVIEIAEGVGWGDLSATYDFLAQAYLGQGKVDEALEAAHQAQTLQAWAEYEMERWDSERGEELKQQAEDICERLGISA